MKTKYFSLFIMMNVMVHAQFTDDIESYSTGPMGTQSDHWSTFSGDPDYMPAIVTNALSATGSKSLFIGSGNDAGTAGSDAFLLLGDKTTGVWTVQFDMYVPSGKTGYYGFQKLENFDGNNNSWAISAIFGSNNTGYLVFLDSDNGYEITPAGDFSYLYNQWFTVTNTVDIVNNSFKFYINSNLLN